MIEITFRKCRICFHFSFFTAVSLLMLCSESVYALYSLYACLLHECGHLLMMFAAGHRIKKLVFYGAGIKIVPQNNCEAINFTHQLMILSSGCAVNFALFALLKGTGGGAEVFGIVNLAVGMFNIMPLDFLDGGKLMVLFFYRFMEYEKAAAAEKCLRGINIIMVPCAAVLLYAVGVRNFTVYVTLIFLLFTSVLI